MTFNFRKLLFFFFLLNAIYFGQNNKLTFEQAFLYGTPFLTKSLPLIRTTNQNNNSYIKRDGVELKIVNIKTGKEKTILNYDKINETLPSGITLSMRKAETEDYQKYILEKENDFILFSNIDKSLIRLTSDGIKKQNPTFSPDEKMIAYTKENNLYIYNFETKKETQLTNDGSDLVYNGYASWVYYEEILGRSSHYRAFYWSPDSRKIAFFRYDDSNVPTFTLCSADGTHGRTEVERYPKPGDSNPIVKLGIINLENYKTVWIDSTTNKDNYIAWAQFTNDNNNLIYQRMNRGQDKLDVVITNTDVPNPNVIYSEEQKTWVDFLEKLHLLKDNSGFVFISEKTGWSHIYKYSFNTNTVTQITTGDWAVKDIALIDEANSRIFFHTSKTKSTNKNLYKINFDGTELKRLTKGDGTHSCTVLANGEYFFDKYTTLSHPGKLILYNIKDNSQKEIANSKLPEFNKYNLGKAELFTIPTPDGYNLPAMWILPPDFDKTKKYPVIFSIYGGPGAATVSNSFPRRGLGNYFLAQNGIIVISVDNRGSGHFGKKGKDELFRNLGKWEIDDLVTAAKWLRERPFVDTSKIAITGGSYGGYTTSMALARAGKYFKFGIAKYAVTDWRLYDDIYTERYMDTPEANPDGYEFASVMNHIENYNGGMLITHGSMDDNVHMQNTMQLIDKLQDLEKDFELMIYPNQRHGIRYPKYPHSASLDIKFWFKNLLNKTF